MAHVPTSLEPDTARVGRRWPLILGVLLIALTAIVGWLVWQNLRHAPPPEVEAALIAYTDAWEATDAEAIRALTTYPAPEFVITEYIYAQGFDPSDTELIRLDRIVEDGIDGVVADGFDTVWEVEWTTPMTSTGDGPWFVTVGEDWVEVEGGEEIRLTGTANYVVVRQGDDHLVARHYWAGLASVTPVG